MRLDSNILDMGDCDSGLAVPPHHNRVSRHA